MCSPHLSLELLWVHMESSQQLGLKDTVQALANVRGHLVQSMATWSQIARLEKFFAIPVPPDLCERPEFSGVHIW